MRHKTHLKILVMKFFNEVKDLADLKAQYRKLAMKFHPDLGGSHEAMQLLNDEYKFLTAKILSGGTFSQSERDFEAAESSKYADIINQIIALSGLDIEICGNWIWVGGNTYPHKEALKEAGFYFARKKVMWYYRPAEYKAASRKSFDIGEIRARYGSRSIRSAARVALN